MEKVKDIHKPVTRALVDVLPESPRVKWALEKPRQPLEPDCRLYFIINDLKPMSSLVPTGGLPALYTDVLIQLEHIESGTLLYLEELTVNYDFWLEPNEELKTLKRLDNYHEKIARELKVALDKYLAQN